VAVGSGQVCEQWHVERSTVGGIVRADEDCRANTQPLERREHAEDAPVRVVERDVERA
jgi:hypothetical protein